MRPVKIVERGYDRHLFVLAREARNKSGHKPPPGGLGSKYLTKLKLILPVGKYRVWNLLTTAGGISSWLAHECRGDPVPGRPFGMTWRDGSSEEAMVVYMGEKHSSFRFRWRGGAEVRFYLHGRLTTLTLEVEYPKTRSGEARLVSELPFWTFALANLKSVALGGPDLRNDLPGRISKAGFIDRFQGTKVTSASVA
ncbi:MAG: hypothetical protein HY296_02450 [Thaumarchaeota archaeon]|nr:hypothetical protein [Nitrososphaerota archaeon]